MASTSCLACPEGMPLVYSQVIRSMHDKDKYKETMKESRILGNRIYNIHTTSSSSDAACLPAGINLHLIKS